MFLKSSIVAFSLLGFASCAANTTGSDAGVPLTDASEFNVATITVSAAGDIYALGTVVKSGEVELRTITPQTNVVTSTVHLKTPHQTPSHLRLGANGFFYFIDQSIVTGSTNNTDGASQINLWSLRPSDGLETRFDHELATDDDYVLSPTANAAAFGGYIDVLSGGFGTHIVPGVPVGAPPFPYPSHAYSFSPDGAQLLADSNIGGLRLFAVSNDIEKNVAPDSQLFPHSGEDVLFVRWDANRFQAITRTDATLYLEDLNAHTSQTLWSTSMPIAAWGDDTHVFQAAGATCTEGGGLGGQPCHRVDFSIQYRSLTDPNDARQVAHASGATGGDITLMPDAHSFVWVVDGTLFTQSL